ncbi:MAG: hypothetical protein ACMXYC_01840 [Candidatus Woesearchaeota archaeon]
MKRTAQMWSIEVVLAITTFIVVFVFIVAFLSLRSQGRGVLELQQEAVKVSEVLGQHPQYQLIKEGRIDSEQFIRMRDIPAEQLRRELGVDTHFCLFMLDEDDNLVPVYFDGENVSSFGSQHITIDGLACGEI